MVLRLSSGTPHSCTPTGRRSVPSAAMAGVSPAPLTKRAGGPWRWPHALDSWYFVPAFQPPSGGGPITTLVVPMSKSRRGKVKWESAVGSGLASVSAAACGSCGPSYHHHPGSLGQGKWLS